MSRADVDLGDFAEAFVRNGVDGDMIALLTHEALTGFGISNKFQRDRILTKIESIKQTGDVM